MTDDRFQTVAELLGTRTQRNVSLAPLCTYRVGGSSAFFVEVRSEEDVEAIRRAVQETGIDTLVVGRGSNLLVSDQGFNGIAIQLGSEYTSITTDTDGVVTCGASALLPVAARQTAKAGLGGFEWAVGVPGSVGGGVRMNAGGHGADINASLTEAVVADLEGEGVQTVTPEILRFGYRKSSVTNRQIVLSASFQLEETDPAVSKQQLSEIVRWRRENQPGGQNAGSVFRNPDGDSAGRLIEQCGLKGHRVGSAEVSQKHANFIQADADGSADDVYRLIRDVQSRIFDEFGIHLHPENCLIGFESTDLSALGGS